MQKCRKFVVKLHKGFFLLQLQIFELDFKAIIFVKLHMLQL